MRRFLFLLVLFILTAETATAEIRFRNWDEDADEPRWQEEEAALPTFPKDENLLEFYVSAVTTNRFFIDGATLNPGADGVVRYSLVVRTAGGATNVSFEGLRCATLEHRLYATGRSDGTWAKARASEWKLMANLPANRQHAALSRDYLCPSRVPIRTAEEGRDALRRGGHPDAK